MATVSCSELHTLDRITHNYNVICIDEIQFFEDAPVFCDKWASEGLTVEVAGLSGMYNRKPFHVISQLIPLAEEIVHKHAICSETGFDANYTDRLSNDSTDIVIGGVDKYRAVDRITFLENKCHYINDLFDQFVNTYCAIHHVELSNVDRIKGYQLVANNIPFPDIMDVLLQK
jgi:thymidine kinase